MSSASTNARCPRARIASTAAAEIATVLTGLGLITGAVWGRPTWGVYWVWDARLTSTAILFVLLLGYQALRRYPAEPQSRSRMAADDRVILWGGGIYNWFDPLTLIRAVPTS